MKLIRDLRGQTMVFGAISFFILVSSTTMIYNVGQVVTSRVEMQNAADAAARSGALAEANLVSTIAFLNDGMAYVYYNTLRYATNVTVFGVLAELKEAGASDGLIGVSDPVARYNDAYQQAQDWVPRCYRWLDTLARMERAIAVSGDLLVKREMRRSAVENARHNPTSKGVEAIALFPDFTFRPHLGSYLRLEIDQIDPNNGWHITSNTGYMIEIRRLAPHHWMITSTDGVQIECLRLGPNHYKLTTASQELEIERPTATHVIAKVRGPKPTNIDCTYLDGIGWAINAISEDVKVQYEPMQGGGYRITCVPGGSVGVRRGPDGKLEQWDGIEWGPIEGDRDEIDVGGRTIPIQHSNTIALPGNASLDLPNSIRIGAIRFNIPDHIEIGSTGITLRSDSVRITARVGPATFVIDDMGSQPHLEVNGLTTRDADGRWRIISQRGTRHRMQQPDPNDNFWIYEYVSNAAYLWDDSLERMVHHGIQDNDPYSQIHVGSLPAWTQWFNPLSGHLVNPVARPEDRDNEPETPRPGVYSRSVPAWDSDQDGDLDDDDIWDYKDSDGRRYVRRYVSDMVNANVGRRAYPCSSTRRDYISIDINAFPRPLRVTDDFLKFGINVGVWKDKDAPVLEGSKKDVLRVTLFENPPWGYFAVASARCAFLDGPETGRYWRTTFDTRDKISKWVERSYQNLYEPVWTAKLVSTREAIKSEHIDCIKPDTGTNFMWRGLAGGSYTWYGNTRDGATWHDPDPPEDFQRFRNPRDDVPEKFRNMTNRQKKRFDHTSGDLPGAIDH